MAELIKNALSTNELSALSTIVRIGNATYQDLIKEQSIFFGHRYFRNELGKIQTKLIQMQCEIESHNPTFPFSFYEKSYPYGQLIPELRTEHVILHIARSKAPNILPSPAKYKILLSNNNTLISRQLVFNNETNSDISLEPFYGILVFGGRIDFFATIQFPEPGYEGIAYSIDVPQFTLIDLPDDKTFERKKATLKQKLAQELLEENG